MFYSIVLVKGFFFFLVKINFIKVKDMKVNMKCNEYVILDGIKIEDERGYYFFI